MRLISFVLILASSRGVPVEHATEELPPVEHATEVIGLLGTFDKRNAAPAIEYSLANLRTLGSPARLSTASPFCGGDVLFNRSYLLPTRFPFPPIRLVMERIPRTCDLYRERKFCDSMAAGETFEPEYHTREAIASFLDGCHWRQCVTLDLGANNGWFTAYALSLGSQVIAVEPQEDLARAVEATIKLNCWASKGKVLNAWAEKTAWPLWRATNPRIDRYPAVPVVPLRNILETQRHFELVKMDGDEPEGDWLEVVDEMISHAIVDITTIIVECNNCRPALLHRFQQTHRYDVYLLDVHIDHRFLNSKGIDVYSHFEPVALPNYMEEMYSIRFLRHVYHLNFNMTVHDWENVSQFTYPSSGQYVLTKEQLLETRLEHPASVGGRVQAARKARALANIASERCWHVANNGKQRWIEELLQLSTKLLGFVEFKFGLRADNCNDRLGEVCLCVAEPCKESEHTCAAMFCDTECSFLDGMGNFIPDSDGAVAKARETIRNKKTNFR